MLHPSILDQLKLTHEGLNAILSNLNVAVLIESVERKVLFVNKAFCHLFSINQHPNSLIDSSVVKNAKQFSLQFKDHEQYYHSLLYQSLVNKNNEVFDLKNGTRVNRSFQIFEVNSKSVGYIWTYQPLQLVEKENFQQNAISSNENKILPFEQILNHLPHPIALYNRDREFEFANKAFLPSTQKRSWIKGKTLSDWYSYENKNIVNAHDRIKQIDKALVKNECTYVEETFISDAISKQTIRWNYIPIINNLNEVDYILEHGVDITNQKQLEEKLKQTTQHLFNVLNSCNDFIIQTNDSLDIQFINKSFTGFLKEKKLNSLPDAFELKQYELYKKIFAVLLGDNSDNSGKLSLLGHEGKEKLFKYNLQPNFNVEDGNNGILITLNDITTKEMEEAQLLALIKREKELNELKTAFVNMVSHELRTPLTVISSSAEILDLLIDAGKAKEDLQVHTKQIVDEVEKMTAFMQDLLMVSKIEAGKIEPNLNVISINALLNRIVKQQFSPFKDGRICTLITKNEERALNIDANMISHVIQNVLSNAFKYSTNKAAPYIRISYASKCCYISVVDAGIGIPDAEKSKLFTSFFRASNTSNISGTGIGLMVVKYFTQQHKGDVFVRTKLNKGTIFTIKLPY